MRSGIFVVWIAFVLLFIIFRAPDWTVFLILSTVAIAAIVDYYWLSGKLFGRSFIDGKK